jgi:hypothetical protein
VFYDWICVAVASFTDGFRVCLFLFLFLPPLLSIPLKRNVSSSDGIVEERSSMGVTSGIHHRSEAIEVLYLVRVGWSSDNSGKT